MSSNPTVPYQPNAPLKVVEQGGIRRFTDARIQSAVDAAAKRIPDGHKFAAIAHADLDGASITLVARLGDKWSVAAGAYKPYNGALKAEADVLWSPF